MSTEASPLLSQSSVEPESLLTPGTKTSDVPTRISTFDLTRGLICLLMAIDHTFFISGKEHPTESYQVHPDRHHLYLTSWYHYGLRFVTHTCAPGFCVLMGIGIVYFVESRVGKIGWSLSKAAKYLALRGLLFALVGFVSMLPFRQAFKVHAFIIVDIIMTLGIDFLIAGLFVLGIRRFEAPRFSNMVTACIGILAVALANLTILLARYPESKVIQLLWLSGGTSTSFFVSRFPPLSWLPLVLYGVFYGRLCQRFPRRTALLSFLLSAAFFLLFLAVRLPASWGNLTPVKSSWFRKGAKEFFWTNKYCPDLAFMALFTAINHLFIVILAVLPRDFPAIKLSGLPYRINTHQVLLDIGTSPFAFYFAHMYSLMAIGAFLRAMGWVWSENELGAGYTKSGLGNGWTFWLVYAIVVLWMWFVCRSYGTFKKSKDIDSPWRFF